MSNLMKNPSSGISCSMRTDRRTYGRTDITKPTVALHTFTDASKNTFYKNGNYTLSSDRISETVLAPPYKSIFLPICLFFAGHLLAFHDKPESISRCTYSVLTLRQVSAFACHLKCKVLFDTRCLVIYRYIEKFLIA
jgi:hypothetical protein